MDGLDVMNDDLIPRIDVALAVEVVGDVEWASIAMSKVLCHGLSQSRAVSGR